MKDFVQVTILHSGSRNSGCPPALQGAIPTFRLERDGSSWLVDQAHQAWRYGVGIVADNEKALVSWLKQIHGWIQEAV